MPWAKSFCAVERADKKLSTSEHLIQIFSNSHRATLGNPHLIVAEEPYSSENVVSKGPIGRTEGLVD